MNTVVSASEEKTRLHNQTAIPGRGIDCDIFLPSPQ
jgi:pSer/pThr/pTyr-binding forkhead associated (FHA) protein